MSEPKFTPAPWEVGEFSETLGYDCMTAGVRIGEHITLDGMDYGQKRCVDMTADAQARMMADAHLIAAAPELYEALKTLVEAKALSKVEGIVAGWNGPPEKPYSPHPPQLGARIETTCGRVYELEQAMRNARYVLAKARGET